MAFANRPLTVVFQYSHGSYSSDPDGGEAKKKELEAPKLIGNQTIKISEGAKDVAFSSDGQILLVAERNMTVLLFQKEGITSDSKVKKYELQKGAIEFSEIDGLSDLANSEETINSCFISPNKQFIALKGAMGSIVVLSKN